MFFKGSKEFYERLSVEVLNFFCQCPDSLNISTYARWRQVCEDSCRIKSISQVSYCAQRCARELETHTGQCSVSLPSVSLMEEELGAWSMVALPGCPSVKLICKSSWTEGMRYDRKAISTDIFIFWRQIGQIPSCRLPLGVEGGLPGHYHNAGSAVVLLRSYALLNTAAKVTWLKYHTDCWSTEITMTCICGRWLYRRPGQSRITTPRKESDTCKILSGVGDGQSHFPSIRNADYLLFNGYVALSLSKAMSDFVSWRWSVEYRRISGAVTWVLYL